MAWGMISKRSIVLFWALFLVPTLIMAGVAFTLLSHEQERINKSSMQGLVEKAKTISETIHLTIEAVQENLTRSLLDIEQGNLLDTLLTWEKTNPLVRNVFIFQNGRELDYPVSGMESTPEERQFIVRYDSLFSGRTKFDFNTGFSPEESEIKLVSSRQKLVALSRPEKNAIVNSGQALKEKSGWIPWFSENRLYILGWVRKNQNGPMYGVELELMTLLSRLVTDFPELPGKGAALVLMDGSGRFMHQSGEAITDSQKKPAAVLSVSSLLPHWRIAVFMDDKGFGTTRSFIYVSVILLAIFIAAIVSGGVLLTRLTLQTMKDARQKTSFVSSVSHELKTPLTSIRMYAELLLSKRINDEDKKDRYLSVIVGETARLTRLINNVLDFGNLEQGKKTYQFTRFDLEKFLYQVIRDHGIRIKNQGLEIITEFEQGQYFVRTDKDAMEQVVLNLLDNALKYAGKGKFIKFVLKKQDNDILLKICDNGPGIPKSQEDMIFEKFHRIDNSLTTKQPGSGLGLSIARQILRDLEGDLFFEPMPGNGSCFTARIKHNDQD